MLTIDSDPSEIRGKYDEPRLTEICRCGHQQGKHLPVISRGTVRCDGARGSCECVVWDAVIKVPDVRVFMYGPGANGHPLVLGMIKTKEKGKYEQIVFLETECFHEGCSNEWKTAVYIVGGKDTMLVCARHAIRTAETE